MTRGLWASLPSLDGSDPATAPFPEVSRARRSPNGLLARGGDLEPERLVRAYREGIFPWYEEGEPILWWSPHPREVLFPEKLHVPRRLARTIRRGVYESTLDVAFRDVILGCAKPRKGDPGTWITAAMVAAYTRLHELGHAHSAESWLEGELAGGIYGVAVGKVFAAESMFARRDDASKVALVRLVRQLGRWGFALVDCQVRTAHMRRFGSESVPRARYSELLGRWRDDSGPPAPWRFDPA